MRNWILGILGTVIAGLLLQLSTNFLGLGEGTSARATPGSTTQPASTTTPRRTLTVMGPLEIGTNRQGYDFDAFGKPAGNAELCAEMCRADTGCDAMTFVKSTKVCWLKSGVPAASADVDMISAIKAQYPG